MVREEYTYEGNDISLGTFVSIARHELEENNPYNVEVNKIGSGATIEASHNLIDINKVSGRINMTIDADEAIHDVIIEAVNSQGENNLKMTGTGQEVTGENISRRAAPAEMYGIARVNGEIYVVAESVFNIYEGKGYFESLTGPVLELSQAGDEYASYTGEGPDREDRIDDPDQFMHKANVIDRPSSGRSFDEVVGENMAKVGEVQAEVTIYEDGTVNIDKKGGERRTMQTAAGFFLLSGQGQGDEKLEMGEAYVADSSMMNYTEADIRRALHNIEEIVGDM